MKVAWTFEQGGKPEKFMTTSFEVGKFDDGNGQGFFGAEKKESEVLKPWNSWRRLVPIDKLRQKDFTTDPRTMERLPFYTMEKGNTIWERSFPNKDALLDAWLTKDLSKIVWSHAAWVPAFKGSLADQSTPQATPQNLSEWKQNIQGFMKTNGDYKSWVDTTAPDPGGQPDQKKDPGKWNDWNEKKKKRERYSAAGPDEVAEYWGFLKNKLPTDKQSAQKANFPEDGFTLCCLHCELEAVLDEKQKAKALLEAVGEGTIIFTGKVWADPMNDGKTKVLLASFEAPKEPATPAPESTPESDTTGTGGGGK